MSRIIGMFWCPFYCFFIAFKKYFEIVLNHSLEIVVALVTVNKV